jgi:cytosine/adenosine deaminase-related metal-dependent hydrolase
MVRRACFLLSLFVTLCAFAQERPVALTGTLVTPDQIIPDGTIVIQHGHISAVGAHVAVPEGVLTVHTNGIIAPGLIDLHNHLTWNIFPRWKPTEEFGSRYDWQQKPVYHQLIDAPHKALVEEGLECAAERYAEVKAITEGETSVTGSLRATCNRGLARNLDDDPELGKDGTGRIVYNVFPLQMSEPELADAKQALSTGGSLLIHLAEGAPNDASAAREFTMLAGRGLLLSGVSLIHAVGLSADDFAVMQKAGVGFVWSPRSNIELYGDTARVDAAKRYGVVTALAPDWSPTGSDGLLEELKYAAVWNLAQTHPLFEDRELVAMATENPAKLVHLDKALGRLKAGYVADLLVLHPHGKEFGKDAYWSIAHSSPQDVDLVMIGGQAVYGDPETMRQLSGSAPLESLTVCGAEKRISFASEHGSTWPDFQQTEAALDKALREWGTSLAPLAECRD